jgi:acyl-CoA reductase-like NAD-dependent aldehyde dehydrogenase
MIQADVDIAVAAAKRAFARNSVWRSMDASDRGKLMLKVILRIVIIELYNTRNTIRF